MNGYGQCECGATVTTDITSHKFSNIASGIPLPGITTVGVFDDDYKELKYGQRGNILVRTDIGMLEYYKQPEATRDFFYEDANGDKWSKTGDIGYINEDGSLVVLGRKSDYSVIDGNVVFNFDIERAILESDQVKLCEVQTHPDDNNRLVAHIVWENETSAFLKLHPEKLKRYYIPFKEMYTMRQVLIRIVFAFGSLFQAHIPEKEISITSRVQLAPWSKSNNSKGESVRAKIDRLHGHKRNNY